MEPALRFRLFTLSFPFYVMMLYQSYTSNSKTDSKVLKLLIAPCSSLFTYTETGSSLLLMVLDFQRSGNSRMENGK